MRHNSTHIKRQRRCKVKPLTYSKIIVFMVMIHGMLLTTLSYILAFFDKDPVVDVSSTIVREIVAPVIVYLATNMVMNIFEKNKLSFSMPLTQLNRDESNSTEDSNLPVG